MKGVELIASRITGPGKHELARLETCPLSLGQVAFVARPVRREQKVPLTLEHPP